MPRSFTRVRPLTAALAGLLTLGAVLLAGCGGGSSQSVISTGFPQGAGPFTFMTHGASAGGSLQLSASNLANAVFFPAPNGVSDAGASGCSADVCSSASGGSLALIPGTVYQLQNPTQPKGPFPSPVTLTISYPSATGHDLNTLDIYFYDGKKWQPVIPSPGTSGFLSKSGQVQTTLTVVQGTGLYAVMSSAPPKNP